MSNELTPNEIKVLRVLAYSTGSWDHGDLIAELGLDNESDISDIDEAIISLRERSYLYGGLFHCTISSAGIAAYEEATYEELDPLAMVYAGMNK